VAVRSRPLSERIHTERIHTERIHTERIHTERIDTERIGADRTVSDDGFDALDDALRVRQMLATLPPLEQEALRLTEWDQFDIGEAAVIAGCSRATFRVRLHRARRRLARRLSEELHETTRENP
jgi:RNA polymerase sigma factor (sigma-70 family)